MRRGSTTQPRLAQVRTHPQFAPRVHQRAAHAPAHHACAHTPRHRRQCTTPLSHPYRPAQASTAAPRALPHHRRASMWPGARRTPARHDRCARARPNAIERLRAQACCAVLRLLAPTRRVVYRRAQLALARHRRRAHSAPQRSPSGAWPGWWGHAPTVQPLDEEAPQATPRGYGRATARPPVRRRRLSSSPRPPSNRVRARMPSRPQWTRRHWSRPCSSL